jgi:hypothetical protein
VKLKLSIAVAAALVLAFGVSAAQAVTVRNVVNITHDDNGDNELDIAINPTNPLNMIAGWNDYGVGNSCGVGWTTDGGKTWQTDWLRGMTPAGGNPTYDYGAGDPSVGLLNDGTAIFTCNAWSIKKPTAIYVTTSGDGGATWAAPQQVASADTKAGNLDHPMMTIDHYGNRALLAYTTWSGLQANSWALVSNASGTAWSGPYRIAADYKSNAPTSSTSHLPARPTGPSTRPRASGSTSTSGASRPWSSASCARRDGVHREREGARSGARADDTARRELEDVDAGVHRRRLQPAPSTS